MANHRQFAIGRKLKAFFRAREAPQNSVAETTWRIKFGNQNDRAREIATYVDHTRFKCEFGVLNSTDISRYDCVVPLTLSDYEALRSHDNFNGTKFWLPDAETVETCHDKLSLNHALLEGEFAEIVPALRTSRSNEFPYILKKRQDEWGCNSFVVRNSDDERAMAALIESPDYFCQTYIFGSEEYALHVLFINNEVAYAQTVKYEMGSSSYVKGKRLSPVQTTYLSENYHLARFHRVLAALGFNGTCCINYKMDNGLPMLLEINPRIGASLTSCINEYLESYLLSLGLHRKADNSPY
ncbi:MAG TPA: ATP-grasp domain-containing protein [Terriglobales bacterium]|nr:ATP-grasp domain-containing protein [Terriglobales bacterium]